LKDPRARCRLTVTRNGHDKIGDATPQLRGLYVREHLGQPKSHDHCAEAACVKEALQFFNLPIFNLPIMFS
jgi:hypothetical protein